MLDVPDHEIRQLPGLERPAVVPETERTCADFRSTIGT